MANQVLMTISQDEDERARLMRDEKILLDYYSGLSYAKKTGIKIGEQRGDKKGRKERDQEIIDLWKSGIPAEEILKRIVVSG